MSAIARHSIRTPLASPFITIAAIALATFTPAHTRAADAPAEPANKPDRMKLEQRFQDSLAGATFDGFFTETALDAKQPAAAAPQPARYKIEKVAKLKDDLWLFTAQIAYEGHDVTLPIPLAVQWAGDTPVITLDKLALPGLGVFTARVLVYDTHFAGMWSGGSHRGELFGRIVKEKESSK